MTAAVIGGVSFTGGTGTVLGAVLGALFLAFVNNGLILIGVEPSWQNVVVGAILILSIVIDVVSAAGGGEHGSRAGQSRQGRPRGPRRREDLPRRERAEGRQRGVLRRADPRDLRGERCRQVDAHAHPRRRLPGGCGNDAPRRGCPSSCAPSTTPTAGISHRLPGAQPRPGTHGGREHLRRPPAPRFPGVVDWKGLTAWPGRSSASSRWTSTARRLVGDVPAAIQQMVEIAKALSVGPRVLILDEPTATVTERESEALFALLRRLRERGIAIIYISHRLAEIFRDRRPRHGPEGRGAHGDRGRGLGRRAVAHQADGRARPVRHALPGAPGRGAHPRGRGALRRRAVPGRRASTFAPARSWASPGSWARAGPRSSRRCSGSPSGGPEGCASSGGTCG